MEAHNPFEVFDLVVDDEDLSLVADVLRDASYTDREFDFRKLAVLLKDRHRKDRADEIYRGLLADSGLLGERTKK